MKISIITASLNSGHNIKKNVSSVRSQTYKIIEHIIIDGASNDNTREILLDLKFDFRNFYSEADNGIYSAFNKGISKSDGEIIGFLNSDDIYADDNILQLIIDEFVSDKNLQAVYGDLVYINKNGEVIRKWKSSNFKLKLLKCGWMPPHPTLYIRKSYLSNFKFCEDFKISADYLMVLQLFSDNNFKTKYICKDFIKMRVGGASNGSFYRIIIKTYEDFLALHICNFNYCESIKCVFLKNTKKLYQFFYR